MTIGEDRNKTRLEKNDSFAVFESSRFVTTILCLLYQSVYQSPCSASVSREYDPNVLELLYLLQCIAAHLQPKLPYDSGET